MKKVYENTGNKRNRTEFFGILFLWQNARKTEQNGTHSFRSVPFVPFVAARFRTLVADKVIGYHLSTLSLPQWGKTAAATDGPKILEESPGRAVAPTQLALESAVRPGHPRSLHGYPTRPGASFVGDCAGCCADGWTGDARLKCPRPTSRDSVKPEISTGHPFTLRRKMCLSCQVTLLQIRRTPAR